MAAKETFESILSSKSVPNPIKALTLKQLGELGGMGCVEAPCKVWHDFGADFVGANFVFRIGQCGVSKVTIVFFAVCPIGLDTWFIEILEWSIERYT